MAEEPIFTGSDIVPADAILPHTLFVIPVYSSPIYPGMIAPIIVSKPKAVETVNEVLRNKGILGLVLAADERSEDELLPVPQSAQIPTGSEQMMAPNGLPTPLVKAPEVGPLKGMYKVGTAVRVIKKLNTSEGAITLLVHSLKRFELKKVVRQEPYAVVQVDYKDDVTEKSVELDALTRLVIGQVKKLSEHNPFFTEEIKLAMVNAPGAAALADLVAFALSLKKEEAQDFLETTSIRVRFEKLLFYLRREQEVTDVQKKISEDVNKRVQQMQREFFLKEQLRSIKRELGGDDEGAKSFDNYKKRIETMKLSEEARKVAKEELRKLEMTSENSPEYNVIRNYLDWMLDLPWGIVTKDNLDLKQARKILDEDHYGIAKVKDRILEYLAVRKLNPEAKSSILCLVGPPGVGKTSLGKSIARAMGRNFFRFSLGGMRDEAEIKGHRRTYIGAMPGKLLNAMKRSASQNPVLLLDEVDKLGMSFQGDPASALLEVLDPEQNQSFLDHYLDVPFDLSKVMFVLTANSLSSIPEPLLDRMEIIEMTGYTLEEKEKIAVTHVIPKELKNHGLTKEQLQFPKETLHRIMLDYCREPGMRSAQKMIATICRKVATKIVESNSKNKLRKIKPEDLYNYLGPEKFENELARSERTPGVVVGLAWTPMGGQILFVEAGDVPKRPGVVKVARTKAKSQPKEIGFGNIQYTGQLGAVMTESVSIAYSFVKKKLKNDKGAVRFFEENDIHVHVPAGAIPKDGPSAGITMAVALYSLATGKPTKSKLAMTGELSLVGKVLPVGGIREKVLAAKRAGIKTVILPKKNKKDLKEMSEDNIKGLHFEFVETIDEVFKKAF
ncbi:MAG: endopeptidase La [Bacteriovoracia bacterium]